MRPFASAAILFFAIFSFTMAIEAHKGVTAKHTYNADVYPIFLNRCGRCHTDGGVGPMSLLSYDEAYPWAESLRAELLQIDAPAPEHSASFVAAAHRNVTARELDVILDWATGGTPQGNPAQTPPPVSFRTGWTRGRPDAMVELNEHSMPAASMDEVHEFAVPVALPASGAIAAIDLMPGTPAIVREADFELRTSQGTSHPLGRWTPQQNPAAVAVDPPVAFTSGAVLAVRIHYRKTWKYEGQPMVDRSTAGLYFAAQRR